MQNAGALAAAEPVLAAFLGAKAAALTSSMVEGLDTGDLFGGSR